MVLNTLYGKTALITGANKGMGYQITLALACRKCKVIMADKDDQTESRDKIIRDTSSENISSLYLDLASFHSVRSFTKEIVEKEGRLDILINNAGVFCMNNQKTDDGLDAVMQVNHFGPFLLTHLLLEALKKSDGGRIIFVTSAGAFLHNLSLNSLVEPRQFSPSIVSTVINYYNSKLCNMIVSKGFAEKLQQYNVTSNCLHPGMTNTSFLVKRSADGGYLANYVKNIAKSVIKYTTKDVVDAAAMSVFLATSDTVKGISGKYFVDYQVRTYPKVLEDEEFCRTIWDESERLVGIDSDHKNLVSQNS